MDTPALNQPLTRHKIEQIEQAHITDDLAEYFDLFDNASTAIGHLAEAIEHISRIHTEAPHKAYDTIMDANDLIRQAKNAAERLLIKISLDLTDQQAQESP
jgi:hypothetical protein